MPPKPKIAPEKIVEAYEASGRSRVETARRLGIAPATVAYHLSRSGVPSEGRKTYSTQKIVETYVEVGGNKQETARRLGISSSTVCHHLELAGVDKPVVGGSPQGEVKTRKAGLPSQGVRRYILTCAQNNTKVLPELWTNVEALAEHYDAEILVSRITYNITAYTAQPEKPGKAKKRTNLDDALWYDPAIKPHLNDERIELAPGLVWCGELNILPTAARPLSGLETYTGRKSAIVPHTKLAMDSVPSGRRPTWLLDRGGQLGRHPRGRDGLGRAQPRLGRGRDDGHTPAPLPVHARLAVLQPAQPPRPRRLPQDVREVRAGQRRGRGRGGRARQVPERDELPRLLRDGRRQLEPRQRAGEVAEGERLPERPRQLHLLPQAAASQVPGDRGGRARLPHRRVRGPRRRLQTRDPVAPGGRVVPHMPRDRVPRRLVALPHPHLRERQTRHCHHVAGRLEGGMSMNSGINIDQLRRYVVRPALKYIGLHSAESENLVLGTALVESGGRFIKQVGGGPALGMWQMEPATHQDIWDNWLRYKDELADLVRGLQTRRSDDFHEELIGNMFYGAAMCRIFYRRLPDSLPADDDYTSMAELWKRRYNTYLGAGTVEKALPYFRVACTFEHE